MVYFVQIIRFDGRLLFLFCFWCRGGGGCKKFYVPSLTPVVLTADNSNYPVDKSLYSG